MRSLIGLLLSSLILCSPAAAQGPPADLDDFVARVMDTFEVPGIAVTIVKDGEVVLTKGYGIRSLGEDSQVNEHTLFGIASNTKAFTATSIALLVEEGKLDWDAPVVNYLPSFRLSDPYVTKELSIRDLLVHRSGLGLGAGDLLWWPPSTYDRKEIVRRLRYIPLSTSFRSAYAYDNVLYTVAGAVIEAVSGLTWEDFVQTRIFDKIGMSESNVRHSATGPGGNVANTHAPVDGNVQIVAPFSSDNVNPAGGINASATDIAKWLIVQLDSGRVSHDYSLFSPSTTRQLWSIVTPIPTGRPPDYLSALKANFNGYALGFGIRDYRGRLLVTHTGYVPGFMSRQAMIPEIKLGVAVYTNSESGEAFDAITQHILDAYLGANDTDWFEAYSTLRDRTAAYIAGVEAESQQSRNEESTPSLALAKYTGKYTDAWYGDVYVEEGDDGLRLRFAHSPSLVGDMEHWQYDTFFVRWDDRELRADAFITFVLKPDGSISEARMEPWSPMVDFSYDFQDLLLIPAR